MVLCLRQPGHQEVGGSNSCQFWSQMTSLFRSLLIYMEVNMRQNGYNENLVLTLVLFSMVLGSALPILHPGQCLRERWACPRNERKPYVCGAGPEKDEHAVIRACGSIMKTQGEVLGDGTLASRVGCSSNTEPS